jgi:hypothetical protein
MIAPLPGFNALGDPGLDFTFAPSADIRTDFHGLWEPPLADPKPSRTPRNTDALKDSRKAQKPFALNSAALHAPLLSRPPLAGKAQGMGSIFAPSSQKGGLSG